MHDVALKSHIVHSHTLTTLSHFYSTRTIESLIHITQVEEEVFETNEEEEEEEEEVEAEEGELTVCENLWL